MSETAGTRATLWVAAAGIELTCLYAWAAFTLTLIHDRPYEIVQAAGAFGGASLLASFLRQTKSSTKEAVLVHAFSLVVVTALVFTPAPSRELILQSRSQPLQA